MYVSMHLYIYIYRETDKTKRKGQMYSILLAQVTKERRTAGASQDPGHCGCGRSVIRRNFARHVQVRRHTGG